MTSTLLLLLLLTGGRSTSSFSVALSSFLETSTPPLLNSPVYSLATTATRADDPNVDTDDGATNMNILTYATPVSITPDRMWIIGLYKGTLTHASFLRERRGVLQLLTTDHAPLVRCLGGTSGRDGDKSQTCRNLGFEWVRSQPAEDCTSEVHDPVLRLPHCVSYLTLECSHVWDCGSHDVALCRVVKMEATSSGSELPEHLTTAQLRELGIITEQGRVAVDPPLQ